MDDTPPIEPGTPTDDPNRDVPEAIEPTRAAGPAPAPPEATTPHGPAGGADPFGTDVGPGSTEPIDTDGTHLGPPSPDFVTPIDGAASGRGDGPAGRALPEVTGY